ncbi:MAG: GatB/YqeY domain-containing protein [Methylacidiphilales bacterium]|nr:GatB/YqeY domain-containing protein [Candidatus Methylacidiphilales bacterium]
MSLLEQIDSQLKDAMRAKDLDKANVLRSLKSAGKYMAIEKYGADSQPTDEDLMTAARKEIKKRVEAIESFEKAGRPDVAAKEKIEKTLLETFLPAALSEAEVEQIVKAAIAETGATGKAQMGLVMKAALAKAAGRADGKQVSTLVNKLLA